MADPLDTNSGPQAPILTGPENYQIWLVRIRAKLRTSKVWGLVNGSITRPAASLLDSKAEAEWVTNDQRALGIIVSHVSDSIALDIDTSGQTSKGAYDAIVEKYEKTNAGITAFGTIITLLGLKWDGTSDFATHTGTFQALTSKLASLSEPLSELFKAFYFLRSLPDTPTWEIFRTATLNSVDDVSRLTLSSVINRAANQVANTTSLAGATTTSESVNKASKRCIIHGSGNHSTDDCWSVKNFASENKKSFQDRGGDQKGVKGKSAGIGRSKGSTKGNWRTKESAQVAEEDSDDERPRETKTTENANLVFISKELSNRIEAYLVSNPKLNKKDEILADSGCSSHMTPNATWLLPDSIRMLNDPVEVHLGDDSVIEGTARGTLRLYVNKRINEFVDIHNVLLVPDLATTLISIPTLAQSGIHTLCDETGAHMLTGDTKREIFQAPYVRGLYRIRGEACIEEPISKALVAHLTTRKAGTLDINTLHRRLGHTSEQRIRKMVREGKLPGIDAVTGKMSFCEACTLGKMKKLTFKPHARRETNAPFELVHTDLGGPITPRTPSGFKYWMIIIDDYTRYPWVFFLKEKDEALGRIKQFYTDIRAYFQKHIGTFRVCDGFIQTMRSDGGGEFTGRSVEEYLRSQGIFHETSAAYTQEQNGLAERMNQTIRNMATAMLIDSRLALSYWSEALATATHIIARTPASGIGGEIPFERMFGRPADPTILRPFGCPAYALIPKAMRTSKFAHNARKCVLLGYQSGQKAYRLLDVESRRIFSSRHVIFNETASADGLKVPHLIEDVDPKGIADWGELFWHQRRTVNEMNPAQPLPTAEYGPNDDKLVEDFVDPVGEALEPVGEIPEPVGVQPQVPNPIPLAAPAPGPAPRRPYATRDVTPQPNIVNQPRPVRARREPTDIYRQTLNRQQAQERERRQVRHQQAPAEAPEPAAVPDAQPQPIALDGNPNGEVGGLDAGEGNPQEDAHKATSGRIVYPMPRNAHDEHAYVLSSSDPSVKVPLTLAEALSGPDAEHWWGALNAELNSLAENEVYEVVKIPQGVKPISSKPVLKIKTDASGNIERFKIRIVARGYSQKPGIDYQETFAPVAGIGSVRIILALAAAFNLELDQMDVITAYLNGLLQEDIYLTPPAGVNIPEGYCWKLKRSLYGLKQSGRTWNKTLDASLLAMGLVRLSAETCLYIYRDGNEVCFIVVYVDDLLLAATSRRLIDSVKARLSDRFKMKDLGPAKFILGMLIIRDRKARTIRLSQQKYIEEVLDRTGMANCKPIWTPLPANLRIAADDPVDNTTVRSMTIEGKTVTFLAIIGSLMYAMLTTRPDLAYAVGLLGRYSANPKQCHWSLAKRCLRYLQATKTMELVFDGSTTSTMTFLGFVDASWSDDLDNSRSTGGYVFISQNGALGWSSKLQSMVTLSSTEAEYISMCYAGQHLAWLRSFLEEIGHEQTSPTILYNDNQGAIELAKDPQHRARTKHIQRKYHFVRDDLVAKNQAVIKYIPTDQMVADIMTKALPHDTHWKFVNAMGLRLGSSGSVRSRG